MTTAEWTPEQISEVISKICQNQIDDVSLSRFVHLCTNMGESYMRYLESTGRRVQEKGDNGLPQLACESIAMLFGRNVKGNYTFLARIFTPLVMRNAPVEEWLILLRRVVTRSVQQHATRIYRERNPESARIWRNLRLACLKLPDVSLRRDMMGLTIQYYPSALAPHLPFTHPPAPLQDAAIRFFQPRMTVDELLATFLNHLFSLLNTPIIIRMSELVRLISDYRLRIQSPERQVEEQAMHDETVMQMCIQAAQNTLELIQKTAVQQYIEKKKLTGPEALALYSAAKETLLARLRADYPEELTFVDALRRHWPELNETRYRCEIRPLLDYIVKLYRKEMKRRLHGIF